MIGNKIIELRQSSKIKQDELAKLLKVTRAALSHYENNSREPSLSIIKSLANIFNVSTDFLLEHISKNKSLISENETFLLEMFRALSYNQQKEVLNFINYLVTKNQNSTPPPAKTVT